jgi:hypothetical protein
MPEHDDKKRHGTDEKPMPSPPEHPRRDVPEREPIPQEIDPQPQEDAPMPSESEPVPTEKPIPLK